MDITKQEHARCIQKKGLLRNYKSGKIIRLHKLLVMNVLPILMPIIFEHQWM